MRTKFLISGLALAAALAAGSAVVVPALAQSTAQSPAVAADKALNIGQIHDKLAASGYTSIDEIERKRDGYEVKATDPDGRRVELRVDAETARILKTEVKRDRRDNKQRDSKPAPARS